MNKEDYRKIYEQYYNFKIPKEWQIHHLDLNHTNNSPDNLLALPKDLHMRLHQAYNNFLRWEPCDIKIHTGEISNRTEYQTGLLEYLSIVEECTVYMNLREGIYGQRI